ncbi:CPBP family glutamic-type intramembrane protease [Butyricimonas synergistica]|uniref:CPBP family glutamic-type intramembrane protease n=2 Tax=Butyricimonas synergistica TaxID=544644 RepID=UPI000373BBA3
MNTITDIFQFLAKPKFESFKDYPGNKIKKFFTIFMWLLLIVMGCNILSMILQTIIASKPIMPNPINRLTHLTNEWKAWNIFHVILLSPVLEEFSYRYALCSFNTTKIKISFSLILSFHISYLLYVYKFRLFCGTDLVFHILFLYGTIFFIAAILFLITSLFNKQLTRLENTWNTHPTVIFYLSAILFTIYHIYNMPITFFLSIFAGALIFGYTRIRLGFGYVIALHVLWNLLTSLRLWIS